MLVDFDEIKPILYNNRVNHAWIVNLPAGFGFDEITSLIPQNQVMKIEPTVHANQKTAIINVDDIRDILPALSVTRDKRLFIVIENAEKMNEVASNAILKNLEEPATNIVFVFLTENHNALLPTIRSRAQLLRMKTPDIAKTWSVLDPKNKVDELKRKKIDFLARGSVGEMKALIKSQRQFDERAKNVDMAKKMLGVDRFEKVKVIFQIKKSTKTREVADDMSRLAIEISLKTLESQKDFKAMRSLVKKCSGFERALTGMNKANNLNLSLLLASECVSS